MGGLIVKDSGGDFQDLEPGTYVARCVSVVDIGVQETGWGPKEKVYLGFEVPAVRVKWKDDKGQEHDGPAFIGSRYTMSISAKSILGQHLTSWRGKAFTDDERAGFNLFNVLGAPAMINVVTTQKDGKSYTNIQTIMRLPQGTECPPAETELIAYTPLDNAYAENFSKLHEWQQQLVRKGYKMAEGSTIVGSAAVAQQAAGGPIASGQPAPQPASTMPPQTAEQAMQAAMANQTPPPDDGFDDDIPF